eukprot:5349451-Heterocapsa_arctica.AAC.1
MTVLTHRESIDCFVQGIIRSTAESSSDIPKAGNKANAFSSQLPLGRANDKQGFFPLTSRNIAHGVGLPRLGVAFPDHAVPFLAKGIEKMQET